MASLPEQIGDYKVIQALGKGGMGSVFLAQDPAIGRLVAIKLLREGPDNPELRERFAREARFAGRLRHPNIVTLFHVGEHESQPYIVMEYIPGDTLADLIRRRVPLSLTRKLRIIEDLCRGLAHAHKSGLVHRDIKPANVLVDSEGIVKILDFGIARIGDQDLTRLGMMMGTPNYMSPEQINPGTADHRSDVFAVGLVFYELLSYRRAFPGDNFSVLHAIVNGEPEPIEAIVSDLDADVAAILRRALQKAPDQRYQDIGVMRTELSKLRLRLHAHAGSDDSDDEGPIPTESDDSLSPDTPTILAVPVTQVARHLQAARYAFEAGEYERAIAESNLALALDADNEEAIELRHQARHAFDVAAGQEMLATARHAFSEGRLTTAIETVGKAEALRLTGETGARLAAQLLELRAAIGSALEQSRASQRSTPPDGDPPRPPTPLPMAGAPGPSPAPAVSQQVPVPPHHGAKELDHRPPPAANAPRTRWAGPVALVAALVVAAIIAMMLLRRDGGEDATLVSVTTTSSVPADSEPRSSAPTTLEPTTTLTPATVAPTTVPPTRGVPRPAPTTTAATSAARATTSIVAPPPRPRQEIVRPQPTSVVTTSVAPITVAPTTTSIPATTTSVPLTTTSVPPAPTAEQDVAAIRGVLQQFVDGYKNLDTSAIRRVYPSAPDPRFRDIVAMEVELLTVQVKVDRDRATVTCRRFVRQTGRSGRPQERVVPTTFELRRGGPYNWIIESVR